MARLLSPHVDRKRVLDMGCGGGALSALLSEQGASVVGVDFSHQMLDAARTAFPHLEFVQSDLLELDLGERFDVVCGSAVLHEVAAHNTPALLGSIKRHLKPGGFGFFQENSFFNPAFRFVRNHLVGRYGIPKFGSPDESPFDAERYALYREAFRYTDRTAEVFVLFAKIHAYVVRVGPHAPWEWLDQQISRSPLPSSMRRYFSYVQHIFFSQEMSPEEFRAARRLS